ncbi:MAG: HlyD family secretion protein [Bacteroidia bacterium]
MLNISENKVAPFINEKNYKAFQNFTYPKGARGLSWVILLILCVLIAFMFVPWTQNIEASGKVTPYLPTERPQTINTIIPGQIKKWYVKEGDLVKKGDTIVYLTEIKDAYFDPNLLDRTGLQIRSKESSLMSYEQKAMSLSNQISALENAMEMKMDQAKNKVRQIELKILTDSLTWIAEQAAYSIATEQLQRQEELYQKGLKSKTELEARQLKLQEVRAKVGSAENKLNVSRSELKNAISELGNIANEYGEKLAKSESDRQSAISDQFSTEAEISKMRNQFSNYAIRQGFYYITAPKDGYIVKALKMGEGETLKEGEPIVNIMPEKFQIAVELYVKPMDLPLIQKDSTKVRLQFDGWPALVFSGWQSTSFGTFGGKVVAMDNVISENGKYRILVTPDGNEQIWPDLIKTGTGVKAFAMLKDVPIWYELWRKLNGFPPEFYKDKKAGSEKEKEEKKEEEKKK